MQIYNANEIASYIINYSIENECPVSNLKLQKLLYYVQASSLIENNKILFGAPISAWKYGPVIEEVYHNYKIYLNDDIDEAKDSSNIAKKDKELINKVVDKYKDFSALELVRKTHSEDPWKQSVEDELNTIRVEAIKEYYKDYPNKVYDY